MSKRGLDQKRATSDNLFTSCSAPQKIKTFGGAKPKMLLSASSLGFFFGIHLLSIFFPFITHGLALNCTHRTKPSVWKRITMAPTPQVPVFWRNQKESKRTAGSLQVSIYIYMCVLCPGFRRTTLHDNGLGQHCCQTCFRADIPPASSPTLQSRDLLHFVHCVGDLFLGERPPAWMHSDTTWMPGLRLYACDMDFADNFVEAF